VGHLSTTGRRARRSAAPGFTLVEVVVVVFIVGVALALVTANLAGDDRREVMKEAKRLAGALEYAAALAQWRAEPLGVSAEGGAYRFWRRSDDERWVAFAGDEVLAPYALPPGVSVAPIAYAGAPVSANAILPLRASGRNEPYTLRLDAATAHAVIASDPLNRVHYAVGANAR
jgi:type II secretion system protein H